MISVYQTGSLFEPNNPDWILLETAQLDNNIDPNAHLIRWRINAIRQFELDGIMTLTGAVQYINAVDVGFPSGYPSYNFGSIAVFDFITNLHVGVVDITSSGGFIRLEFKTNSNYVQGNRVEFHGLFFEPTTI